MSFDVDAHAAAIDRDGFTIIEDFLAPDELAEVRRVLALYLGDRAGRNNFEGCPLSLAQIPAHREPGDQHRAAASGARPRRERRVPAKALEPGYENRVVEQARRRGARLPE